MIVRWVSRICKAGKFVVCWYGYLAIQTCLAMRPLMWLLRRQPWMESWCQNESLAVMFVLHGEMIGPIHRTNCRQWSHSLRCDSPWAHQEGESPGYIPLDWARSPYLWAFAARWPGTSSNSVWCPLYHFTCPAMRWPGAGLYPVWCPHYHFTYPAVTGSGASLYPVWCPSYCFAFPMMKNVKPSIIMLCCYMPS